MEVTKYITVLVVCISFVGVISEGDENPADRLYDTATFEQNIGTKDHFVKFFAPWCGHCKKLAPVWTKLSEKYNTAEDSLVTIARVDCTEETKLCSDHGVTGYPTLKLYRQDEEPVKYKGKRDLEALDKFVQDELNPQEAEVPQPPEAKQGLYELTETNFKDHVAKGSHFVKFYAPWCGHCKRLAPVWEQLALGFQHSDIVTIAKVDCTAHRAVCERFEVKGYPTLKFIKDGEAVDSYRGGRDHLALKEYVTKMTASNGEGGEAAPPAPQKEEKVDPAAAPAGEEPVASDSKVVVLTGDNFQAEVASGTTFIKFYAPWCPHCKSLAPVWDELAQKFDHMADAKVAKVDCTVAKELCQKHEIRGYPTLLLFQNGQMAEKHAGPRTLIDLEKFLTSKLPKTEL